MEDNIIVKPIMIVKNSLSNSFITMHDYLSCLEGIRSSMYSASWTSNEKKMIMGIPQIPKTNSIPEILRETSVPEYIEYQLRAQNIKIKTTHTTAVNK